MDPRRFKSTTIDAGNNGGSGTHRTSATGPPSPAIAVVAALNLRRPANRCGSSGVCEARSASCAGRGSARLAASRAARRGQVRSGGGEGGD
jgi:hypothetical protein